MGKPQKLELNLVMSINYYFNNKVHIFKNQIYDKSFKNNSFCITWQAIPNMGI